MSDYAVCLILNIYESIMWELLNVSGKDCCISIQGDAVKVAGSIMGKYRVAKSC